MATATSSGQLSFTTIADTIPIYAGQGLRVIALLDTNEILPNAATMSTHTNAPANHSAHSLDDLINSLSRKCAFRVPVEEVEVLQTHISAVFLATDIVYKLKKPVKLPFLDFSTVELRKHFCEEEVRINERWAPEVYLGVVPVTCETDGFQFEGEGPVVDWAVKMRRLPESATLRSRFDEGLLEPQQLKLVAQRISKIHSQAEAATGDSASRAETTFRQRFNDNWDFARQLTVDFIQPGVLQRLQTLSAVWFERFDQQLRERSECGQIRDVHGDLRLEHVFFFPEQTPPGDILILDGIEFDISLRRTDLVADVAFLAMELAFLGRRDLAACFTEAYFSETKDWSGHALLPLFTAYRSAVRAKVAAIVASESEIPEAARTKALKRSRAHWLWCLSELEQPDLRPGLIFVSGLPGTGKSTLARMLAEKGSFEVLRSDVVRKELFSVESRVDDATPLYSSARTQQVYEECLSRAGKRLTNGERVIVDATFQSELQRRQFIELALDCGARIVWLECTASDDVTKQRLDARTGDASDADWSVHKLIRDRWEPPSKMTQRFHFKVQTENSPTTSLIAAWKVLQQQGLIDRSRSA